MYVVTSSFGAASQVPPNTLLQIRCSDIGVHVGILWYSFKKCIRLKYLCWVLSNSDLFVWSDWLVEVFKNCTKLWWFNIFRKTVSRYEIIRFDIVTGYAIYCSFCVPPIKRCSLFRFAHGYNNWCVRNRTTHFGLDQFRKRQGKRPPSCKRPVGTKEKLARNGATTPGALCVWILSQNAPGTWRTPGVDLFRALLINAPGGCGREWVWVITLICEVRVETLTEIDCSDGPCKHIFLNFTMDHSKPFSLNFKIRIWSLFGVWNISLESCVWGEANHRISFVFVPFCFRNSCV